MTGPDLSALQLLVPGAQPLLDAVRGLPGVSVLAPPHVSLGYPWVPADEALARLAQVRAAAAAVPAFDAELPELLRFDPDARGRVLLHVRPVDEAPVRALAAALGGDLRDVHLSVARVTTDGDPDAVAAAATPLLPLTARVRELQLTVRRAGTWPPGLRFPLGGPAVRREVVR